MSAIFEKHNSDNIIYYSTLKIASRRAKCLHLHMKKVTFIHNMPNLIV